MRAFAEWPSALPHAELATALAGEAGRARVAAWLASHLHRTHDPSFVAGFSFARQAYPFAPEAFLQRIVTTREVMLLGGIRFFGGDVTRPFVDVVAWNTPEVPWEALRAGVKEVWARFRPRHLRVLLTEPPSFPEARVDQTLHVARYADVAGSGGTDGVTLWREDVDAALSAVMTRYAALSAPLGDDLFAADREELAACADTGGLYRIEHDAERAGVLAVLPGAVEWLEGDVMIEQVVELSRGGRGVATRAQRALAKRAPDPSRLLLGTIDEKNHASRISAERAGRAARLHYVFLRL
ncbi:MAG: hypothetical protein AB8I08_24990 [Sandaracinaceae bacterium]